MPSEVKLELLSYATGIAPQHQSDKTSTDIKKDLRLKYEKICADS